MSVIQERQVAGDGEPFVNRHKDSEAIGVDESLQLVRALFLEMLRDVHSTPSPFLGPRLYEGPLAFFAP
jgi:hypothetical protein